MLERICGTVAVVVGLYTAIKILRRTYIEATVGTAKDICVVDAGTIRLDFELIRVGVWPACAEIGRRAMSSTLRLSLKLRPGGSERFVRVVPNTSPRLVPFVTRSRHHSTRHLLYPGLPLACRERALCASRMVEAGGIEPPSESPDPRATE